MWQILTFKNQKNTQFDKEKIIIIFTIKDILIYFLYFIYIFYIYILKQLSKKI